MLSGRYPLVSYKSMIQKTDRLHPGTSSYLENNCFLMILHWYEICPALFQPVDKRVPAIAGT